MKTVRKIFTTYVVTDEYRIVRNNVFKNYEVRNRKTSETEKMFKTLKEAKNYIGFYGVSDKEIKENPKGENMRHLRRMRRNPLKSVSIEKQIGTINDFPPSEQRKIIDNYRDINVDHDWWEFVYEHTTRVLEILGFSDIEINFSGFSSQGDGASFTASFKPGTKTELRRRVKELKNYAPKEPTFNFEAMRFDAEELEYGNVSVYRISSRYYHQNTITSDNEDLIEFARSFSLRLYGHLQAEYDYLTSDEAVKETLESNEYEFDSETYKIF
jgi:hypothetical protein